MIRLGSPSAGLRHTSTAPTIMRRTCCTPPGRPDRELDEAVDLLQSAAQADPLIKGQIEAIRGRLEALKKEQPTLATTPQELHRAYRELLTDINNLLKRKR